MADDSDQVSQDEIDQLQKQAKEGGVGPDDSSSQPDATSSGGQGAVDQSEINALMGGDAPNVASPAPAGATPTTGEVPQDDIDLLLNKAEQALASIDSGTGEAATVLPSGVRDFEFQKFRGTAANKESVTLELMRDVQLDMTIELGRTHMHLEDVLQLKQGAVVPLDKLAGDPADILVNGRLVARGEVLVLNDNFCIRVAELIEGESAA